MKNIAKFLMVFLMSIGFINGLKAQKNFGQQTIKRSVSDSLLVQIKNDIYYSFYNPTYMTNKKPVFTFLKADINWDGNLTSIAFSDSADSTFVNAFSVYATKQNYRETFQKYITVQKLKNVSILIPVNYEPDYSSKDYSVSRKTLTYKEL